VFSIPAWKIGMSYRKSLGDWGEAQAVRLLETDGFIDIKPLNVGFQHPGGDVLARKNGRPYFFSVKARDRFGQNGKPNPGYNIYPEKVVRAARVYKAVPAWLIIRADRRDNSLCSYWGLIKNIPPGKGSRNRVYVSMSETAIEGYECLASNLPDPTIRKVFQGKMY
jgi:hypothetical protein